MYEYEHIPQVIEKDFNNLGEYWSQDVFERYCLRARTGFVRSAIREGYRLSIANYALSRFAGCTTTS